MSTVLGHANHEQHVGDAVLKLKDQRCCICDKEITKDQPRLVLSLSTWQGLAQAHGWTSFPTCSPNCALNAIVRLGQINDDESLDA